VGFGGDESFGADVQEVREEVGGLDFLHEEDAGVVGRGNEVGAEGALVGRVGVGRRSIRCSAELRGLMQRRRGRRAQRLTAPCSGPATWCNSRG
jgi:hypothetical protein